MKSRETLIRLKKFQVDEKRRKVAQIEAMIAEFERIAADLDREIKTEQDRAGIHDPAHFAYPTYAKAAMARRENLKRSADELKVQLDDAQAMLGEAFEELKKVELLDERDQAREKAEANAREQTELDRIAAMRFGANGGAGVRLLATSGFKAAPATGAVFVCGPAVAIQMPANTAINPTTRLSVIGSPTNCVASNAAAIGLTVMVLATRVGVVRCSASTHRMKASAPPPTPR